MNLYSSLFAALLLVSCAGQRQPLVVKQFQLRDQARASGEDPMVRMEKERRLRGAVSMAERKERLGQYYTLIWNDVPGANQGEVTVVFQYQQGVTASLVKRLVKTFPSSDTRGMADFAVIGENYFKNGRVLAWKATLQRGNRVIATRQSYLWQ